MPPAGTAAADDPRPLPRAVAREAARWLACLHSGEATEADRQACAEWRAADPEHDRAWRRAERLNLKLGLLPPAAGLETLGRADRGAPPPDRRAALKTLAVLLTATPAGYLAWRGWDVWAPGWMAEHQTATGERRELTLADGTRIRLDTATAIDVVFSDAERLVVLHRGEILVDTGPDAWRPQVSKSPEGAAVPLRRADGDLAARAQHRPFIVQTRHGRLRALGTRFVVRHLEAGQGGAPGAGEATRVAVKEGAVEIVPAALQRALGATPTVIRAGQQARFDATSVGPIEPADPQAGAWSQGVLFARNQRLADFAVELGRYRRGLLRCAPEVANLRITGAFQLHNTDAVLAALPDTLPVSVVYRTRWWVSIVAPQP
ncbi:hypothetical protein BA022_08795 [Diaphorobacter nitroreducens]|nr:hypothetical protein BA022_08795 [Diaphorobacter nitroreducens]